MNKKSMIFLVDDDSGVRNALTMALELAGYDVQAYASAESVFETCRATRPACMVLDLRMPGMDGLSLQQALKKEGYEFPVIFISGCGTIPATVKAVQEGALDFLEKPLSTDALIARIEQAIVADRRRRRQEAQTRGVRECFAQLTPREREVMRLATDGLSNKEIARVLDISPRTVENHRARVMEKMKAGNIADLCQKATACHELKRESSL